MSSEQSEWKIKLHSNQKEESIQSYCPTMFYHSLLEILNNDNKLTLNIIKKNKNFKKLLKEMIYLYLSTSNYKSEYTPVIKA